MSIWTLAQVDKTLENEIPSDIIHSHNLFQCLSLGRPGACCLMKLCSLILGRAISGLTAVKEKKLLLW